MLTKLLFRTLPDHYPVGSAYAHFPFLNPTYMRKNIEKDANLVNKYIWTRPQRCTPTAMVEAPEGVNEVLSDPRFLSTYNEQMFNIITTPPTVRSLESFDVRSLTPI